MEVKSMAKAVDRQSAQCVGLSSYDRSDGKKQEVGVMVLDGNDSKKFEIPVSKYFKPTKDRYYFPVVDVITVARISERTGKAYKKQQVIVEWHEIN
jgi:hypothetical protein